MLIVLQPAFILHHRPYRETSLIIELFTKEYGRIVSLARGVRISRSRIRSILQPFVPLLVSVKGRGEMLTLTAVEAERPAFMLRGKYLLSAFYLNELLIKVLQKQDPNPSIYTIYYETLLELQNEKFLQKTLRIFEKNLLEKLGVGLQLQYDIQTGITFLTEKYYRFYPEEGFKIQTEDNFLAKEYIFSGKSLLSIASNDLSDIDSLRDAKRLMRLAFATILGRKPLESRKLFELEF